MINAIIFGVFGFLMANVLTKSGEVFAMWPRFIQVVTFAPMQAKKYNWFQYWIAKITYDCAKCIAGFWANLFYLVWYFHYYSPVEHFRFVTIAIFTGYFLNRNLS